MARGCVIISMSKGQGNQPDRGRDPPERSETMFCNEAILWADYGYDPDEDLFEALMAEGE